MLILPRIAVLLALLVCRGVAQGVPEPSTKPLTAELALRESVNHFFQFQVDGQFRLAYRLVARASQDIFVTSPKIQIVSFKIKNVEFSKDDPVQALVDIETQQKIVRPDMVGVMRVPITTWWKTESGEWVWYRQISK